uniref:Uncharacterized protein n=1 Tax=Arcella intermedia TaxID=1963864 RepID=A0A6B2LNY2_9EUKA
MPEDKVRNGFHSTSFQLHIVEGKTTSKINKGSNKHKDQDGSASGEPSRRARAGRASATAGEVGGTGDFVGVGLVGGRGRGAGGTGVVEVGHGPGPSVGVAADLDDHLATMAVCRYVTSGNSNLVLSSR